MATDVHRYFRCMGNWSHSTGSTIRQLNFSYHFCLHGSDVVFAAEPFVDKVLRCSRVDHRINHDLSCCPCSRIVTIIWSFALFSASVLFSAA